MEKAGMLATSKHTIMIAAPMIGVLAVWIISPTCVREG
jgi:hypothetical protein